MNPSADRITRAVIRELEPTFSERRRAEQTFALIQSRILSEASEVGLKVQVDEVGSVGKNTWIRGEADLDVFIIFPEGSNPSDVEKYGLKLGKHASKGKYIISYAEHPYTRARVNGFDLDIVPCIGVKDPSHIITAVDRTPFHKRFVVKQLTPKLREGILLLKRFMTISGVYGAEIRVRGFSGYLAELLVIHYGGFRETLTAAADWNEGVLLDFQVFYANPEDAHVVFEGDPLIVVDPVDRHRNVAAAVTSEKMAIFVSAAREFIAAPSPLYFTYKPGRMAAIALAKAINQKKIQLVGVQLNRPKLVPDILWGQLHKSLTGMTTLLERHGFSVVHGDVWTDEEELVVFLFELSSMQLPETLHHNGPSIYMKEEAERFLRKHLNSTKVVVGPWIQGNRWMVELRRETIRPEDLLRQKLGEARLGADVEEAARKSKRIEVGIAVTKLASGKKSFLVFLNQFLRRRPIWLEWRSKHRPKNT